MTEEKTILLNRRKIVFQLRAARIEKKMSQQALAEKVGTKRSNICRIELGHQNISLDLLLKIAAALGKTVLVTFCDERNNSTEES